MVLFLYSICDKYTDYVYPFPAYSDPAAVRNFGVEINTNPVAKEHPADFDLFKVGEFDTKTGLIKAYVPNEIVASGVSVHKKEVSNVSEQST